MKVGSKNLTVNTEGMELSQKAIIHNTMKLIEKVLGREENPIQIGAVVWGLTFLLVFIIGVVFDRFDPGVITSSTAPSQFTYLGISLIIAVIAGGATWGVMKSLVATWNAYDLHNIGKNLQEDSTGQCKELVEASMLECKYFKHIAHAHLYARANKNGTLSSPA